MGAILSCCVSQGVAILQNMISQLSFNFTLDEWTNLHNAGTADENEGTLSQYAKNLKNCTEESLKGTLKKVVLICCNTYTKPSYSLGVGPLNDSITVATSMKEYGATCYYILNPTSTEYLKWLDFFLENTQEYLMCYYTGHGSSSADHEGDEDDGKDEYLVFDDKFVCDDVLMSHLCENKKTFAKVVLLTDCCHSGSIWDIQGNSHKAPAGIISISAAQDSQTAKQTELNGTEQGVFTFYFFKYLSTNAKGSPNQMKDELDQYLKKFEMLYVTATTTPSYLTEQILPK